MGGEAEPVHPIIRRLIVKAEAASYGGLKTLSEGISQSLLQEASRVIQKRASVFKDDDRSRIRREVPMAKKILVIDDDAHIVDYLVAVLTDNDYETCSAHNGVEALEVLKREKPDLITLDLDMPHEAGPRFYRNMTQIEEFKETPVIVVSGLAGPHRAIKKAVAAISKPFDPEQLVATVRDAIGE